MTDQPRQTLSYLRDLFEARGIKPKSKLGQNFLIDLNLLDLMVRTAELSSRDIILEIGSGTGSLTLRLAQQVCAVLAIEVDPPFFDMTHELTASYSNVYLLRADALK